VANALLKQLSRSISKGNNLLKRMVAVKLEIIAVSKLEKNHQKPLFLAADASAPVKLALPPGCSLATNTSC
jgi:hypothetical protein